MSWLVTGGRVLASAEVAKTRRDKEADPELRAEWAAALGETLGEARQ